MISCLALPRASGCSALIHPKADEFDGSVASGLWTFRNPKADGGTATIGSGLLTVTVPSGSAHDVTASTNQGNWYTQPIIGNSDFMVEGKFTTYMAIVANGYKGQGIVAGTSTGDLLTWLTYAFTVGGGSNNVHSSKIISGVETQMIDTGSFAAGTMWLRMQKVGSVWTLFHSLDGTNWTQDVQFTQAMTIDRVGPYALNCCASAEAVSSTLDYFRRVG